MLQPGPARKVTIFVGEQQRWHGHTLYAAILEYLFDESVSDCTVIRGIAGFGPDHQLHTTRLLELANDLPVRIEFIESTDRVRELLPKLKEMTKTGIIVLADVEVV